MVEAGACTDASRRRAIQHRKGLYSVHRTTWRRQRDQGDTEGLGSKKRSPKPDPLAENSEMNGKRYCALTPMQTQEL